MSEVEKYSKKWILSLVSSNKGIRINPLRYRSPKWYKKLFNMSKDGLLKKTRYSCADFEFILTDKGKKALKGEAR